MLFDKRHLLEKAKRRLQYDSRVSLCAAKLRGSLTFSFLLVGVALSPRSSHIYPPCHRDVFTGNSNAFSVFLQWCPGLIKRVTRHDCCFDLDQLYTPRQIRDLHWVFQAGRNSANKALFSGFASAPKSVGFYRIGQRRRYPKT